MAKDKLSNYVATYITTKQHNALKQLCLAKRPDGTNCMSQVLRDCIDWAYKPLIAHYFSTPLSETQTKEQENDRTEL